MTRTLTPFASTRAEAWVDAESVLAFAIVQTEGLIGTFPRSGELALRIPKGCCHQE
jgi:hypothetical protein